MKPTLQPQWRLFAKVTLALVLMYLLLVHWWFTAPMRAMALERTALREQMQVMQQEVQGSAAVQSRLEQMALSNPGFADGSQNDSGALAAALGQKLDAWLIATPVTCQSLSRTPGPAQSSGRFSRTVVQVRLRCSMQGLVELMHQIERESPAVLIENLDVASRRSMAAVGNQNAGLDVSLDVVVYHRATQGAP
jgi:general secretion pathway protein M